MKPSGAPSLSRLATEHAEPSLARLAAREARGARRVAPQAYDAGRRSRTDVDFVPSSIGPNLLAEQTLGLARRRVRYLVDNNPLISGARNTIRNNVVGNGIDVQPDTGDPELDEQLDDLWRVFSEAVDPERSQTLAQSQGQFFDELFTAGECLTYYPFADAFNSHDAGPAIELIDAERLDLKAISVTRGGNRIRQGVEFDAKGRRIAYHVYLDHPADGAMYAVGRSSTKLTRLQIEDAHLSFVPRRLNQIRGVPWPVAIVAATRMEDNFQEAFLLLARAAACVGVFFEDEAGDDLLDESGAVSPLKDVDGNPIKRLEPGLIGFGKKAPTVVASRLPPPTFGMTEEILQRRIATGLNISYAAVARDFSKATFSATRAEQLEDRKQYRPVQEFIWHDHTRPLYRRWVQWNLASGEVKLTPEQRSRYAADPEQFLRASVIYPGWEWVNPLQEAQATKVELEIGAVSIQDVCAAKGRDWRETTRKALLAEKFRADERKRLGLAAPSDASSPDLPPQMPSRNENDPEQDDDDEAVTAALSQYVFALEQRAYRARHQNGVHA